MATKTSDFEKKVRATLDAVVEMLVEKNEAYGNSALEPVRVFSKADAAEQLRVRIDDKLSRLIKGHEFGTEDTVKDLIGYLVLLLMAEDKPKPAKGEVGPKTKERVGEMTLPYIWPTVLPTPKWADPPLVWH